VPERFRDRREAGRLLANQLGRYQGRDDVVVLGLPRGGVPVAFEVAAALRAPLDVFMVRKLGAPGQEELAIGAVASGGVRVLNRDIIKRLKIRRPQIAAIAARELAELGRRERLFRAGAAAPAIAGRIVILVDDGLATGATMRAAVAAVRRLKPAKIVVAVPVAAREICTQLAAEADELACVLTPEPFYAVGACYCDFAQTQDDEVTALLAAARDAREVPDP
jgi:putative phosphoribosyl transferase